MIDLRIILDVSYYLVTDYAVFCSTRWCLEEVRERYKSYHLWLMLFQKPA